MSARLIKHQATVCVGRASMEAGDLTFVRDGRREYSAFAYDRSWLGHADRFEISPDLPLREGHVTRRAASEEDSPFPAALADTEPDTWGKRVIQRAHAKRHQHDPALGPLTRFDILAAVDDFSRVGALRLRDANGQFLRSEAAFAAIRGPFAGNGQRGAHPLAAQRSVTTREVLARQRSGRQ